ncbi:MAG: hypothetical protein J6B87_06130 [Clostridia bacterium]|nr:hypothetical protein [Clostridia bacterium]
MVDKNTLIKVRNRNKGTVGYTIPDLGNLHRNFQPGETKEVSMDELRKLSWIPGGDVMLKDYLIIENEEALRELISSVEPEYYYTEEDIIKLLQTGTMDQFMDCLEFAPEGTIELVKDLAVKLELNDIQKRDAILKRTGFNVTSAININKESEIDNNEEENKTRRAAPITSNTNEERPVRRVSKYDVVSIKE